MRVLVVHASQTGRTRRLAEAVAAGVRAGGAGVELCAAADAGAAELEAADAVILGSGVHMGGMEPAMSRFLEQSAALWLQGALTGRVGAAFVSAGAGGRGGAELVLLSMLAALAEHGMLIVPMHNRLDGFAGGGHHWGPVAWTNVRDGVAGPTEVHLRAARAHGQHVAECTARWLRGAEG